MDLTQIFGQASADSVNFAAPQVAFNILFSFVLSVLMALVYQVTHKGYTYSKNFVSSLILVTLVVSVIIMVIGNSLARAFALLGAFSIIRFRTAIKDTRDIAFIFLALVIGMAVGTNNYSIAVIGTILILLVVLLLDKLNLISSEKTQYTLSIFVKSGKQEIRWKELDKTIKSRRLLSVSSRDGGKTNEYVYAIDLKNKVNADDLIRVISRQPNVQKANLFSTREELEY